LISSKHLFGLKETGRNRGNTKTVCDRCKECRELV
jgi:hypothetical protein